MSLAWLFFVFAGTAQSQLQSLQIEGPYSVSIGSMVVLSANSTEQETPFWIVLEPIELEYEQVDEGRRLIFAAGCQQGREITVLLLAQQVKEGRIITRQVRRTIQVTAGKIADPVPEPETDLPEPKPPEADLILKSPLLNAVQKSWPNITTDAAKDLTPRVADNMDRVALRCQSGDFQQSVEVWRELSRLNRDSLGVEASAWDPVGIVMQQELLKLSLPSASSHAIHLKAAAMGMRKAYQSNRKNNSTKVRQ
jgi:hypothetical protein